MTIVNEGRIGVGEAIFITVVFIIAKIFLTFPAYMVYLGDSAAWMVMLLGIVLSLFAFLPLIYLLNRFPGRTIVEVGNELVGPYINLFFCLGYLFFLLAVESMVARQFAERALTVAIPDLPVSIAIIGLLFGAVLATYFGLESIGRSTRISFYIVGLMFVLVIILTNQYWETNNLFPVLGLGADNILTGGLLSVSSFYEIFVIAVIYPAIKNSNSKILRYGITSLVISGVIMLLTVLAFILVFPPVLGKEMSLPTFEMARLISYGGFFERMEVVFLPMWGIAALLKLTIGLYAIVAIITRMLRLPYYRPFILPSAVIIISLSLIPSNVSTALYVDEKIIRVWGWIPTFALPAILLIIAILRRKGRVLNEKTT
ncbi:MAG: spore germination protein [Clostridiales bacterium]|nr:spore germination protein [Clostridiales bacterium]MCF8022153.1 spore germination protein [Clostridiales bacterium]